MSEWKRPEILFLEKRKNPFVTTTDAMIVGSGAGTDSRTGHGDEAKEANKIFCLAWKFLKLHNRPYKKALQQV